MLNPVVAVLAQRGRALDPKDRERLVDLLLDPLEDSPDPRVEEAWRTEIRRRVAVYERGEATLFDADEAIAEALRRAR
jgi:hypothetical protein